MIWKTKPYNPVEKHFAWFPKKIGEKRVWLESYTSEYVGMQKHDSDYFSIKYHYFYEYRLSDGYSCYKSLQPTLSPFFESSIWMDDLPDSVVMVENK